MRSKGWCRRRDLNLHGFPHHPLKEHDTDEWSDYSI
jgi:hypothetical protein